MANAEDIYVDPGALCRLYFHQAGSREMALWRRRTPGCLPVTHHGRIEIVNAIALAIFRGELEMTKGDTLLEWFAEDFRLGHLAQVDILWRAALNKAAELSRKFTPELGTRLLDVMHVACAMELGLRHFVTLDEKQSELAVAVGLKLVKI